MAWSVFALVLLAAVTHALWNTWLKIAGDRLVALAVLALGWAVVGLVSIPFAGAPEPVLWPYLLASTLVHTIYGLSLIRAYMLGSLATTYSIARGLGPVVVLIVSVLYLGEVPSALGLLGAVLIIGGIVGLSIPRSVRFDEGLLFSVLTGLLIGAYTLIDGLGARAGTSAHVFAAWLFVLMPCPIVAVALARHGLQLPRLAGPIWIKGLTAGVLSAGAYWIVVWAMSVAHMGLVAALRESSVVLAALMAGLVLKEHVRWTAVLLVFLGIAFMKVA